MRHQSNRRFPYFRRSINHPWYPHPRLAGQPRLYTNYRPHTAATLLRPGRIQTRQMPNAHHKKNHRTLHNSSSYHQHLQILVPVHGSQRSSPAIHYRPHPSIPANCHYCYCPDSPRTQYSSPLRFSRYQAHHDWEQVGCHVFAHSLKRHLHIPRASGDYFQLFERR